MRRQKTGGRQEQQCYGTKRNRIALSPSEFAEDGGEYRHGFQIPHLLSGLRRVRLHHSRRGRLTDTQPRETMRLPLVSHTQALALSNRIGHTLPCPSGLITFSGRSVPSVS